MRFAATPLTLLLTAALHLSAAPPAAGGPPSAPTAARLGTGPVFNQPTGNASRQRAIRSDILARIKAAAPRSRIKVDVYHFWDAAMARALAAAHKDRKVGVQVLIDESSVSGMPSSTSYSILRAALGTDRSSGSFVGLCPKDRSCLGDPGEGKSIEHNKFWLFSHSGGLRNVVLQTSSNLSSGSYSKFWNDSMVVAQAGLHAAYERYFAKAAGMKWRDWRYTRTDAAPYTGYFFPRPGKGNGTDTVYNILDNITCRWNDAGGARRTQVRVAMFKLTRQGIADKLDTLQRQGCDVSIVYADSDSEDSTGTPGTWETLHKPGGPTTRCLHYDDDGDPKTSQQVVHSKTLLVSGRYAGSTNNLVWTGSHNYSGPALRKNGEALLKVDSDTVHRTYLARFAALTSAARPGTQDDTPRCKGVAPQPER